MIIQLNSGQITMLMLLITFFLILIVLILFCLFARDKIEYMMGKEKKAKVKTGKKDDEIKSRFDGLEKDQIDFYFDLSQKNFKDTFTQRDNENRTILSHVAIILAIGSLFGVLIKWSHGCCKEPIFLLVLFFFFVGAFCSYILSIWSIFLSLSLKYEMPTQLDQINSEYFKSDVYDAKKDFAERMTRAAKKNSNSNIRKMYLLDYSRFFQKIALVSLAVIFLLICGKEYLSILFG